MSLHLSEILLLSATFDPSKRQIGLLNSTSMSLDFTFLTFAGTGAVPTLTLNNSSVLIGATFVSVTEPTAISNKFMFSFAFVVFSGSVSGFPIIEPINESLNESINEAINESIGESINESTKQSINEFINGPMNEPMNGPMDESMNESANESMSHINE